MEEIEENKIGYKSTRIGHIPNDWTVSRIGDFTKVKSGGTPKTTKMEYWNGDVRWMSSGDLNMINIYDVNGRITRLGLEKSSASILPRNCILIGLAGQGKTRGTVAINHVELSTNQSVAAIFPTEIINQKYLFYNLQMRYHEIRRLSTGDGGRGGLNLGIISNIRFSAPPLGEQQKIAQILSTWDQSISETQKLIEKLKLRKKGLMQQLLTGQKRLPGFDEEWQEYSYYDLLKENNRPVAWNDQNLYHLISVRRRSGGLFNRESLYGSEILTKNLKTAKVGDFLISKMQIVHGASGIVTEDFNDMKISGSYLCLGAKDESLINMNYFNWMSKTPFFYHQTYVASYGVHIEKMTFNYKSFLKLKTRIPKIDEQNAITKVLNISDLSIREQKEKLINLQSQKKGLMQQLLTGQKRVKV